MTRKTFAASNELRARYDDMARRNSSQAKKHGLIRWLLRASGKDPIEQLRWVMDELKRLDPDHPVFDGDGGIEPKL